MIELSMPHLVRPPRLTLRKPPLLILLHGTGGSEKEFMEVAKSFDERCLALTVRGPFMQSPRHYLWFTMETVAGKYEMNTVQAQFSRQALIKFIMQAVEAYHANQNQVYLLGFDQGAVMSLSLMLTEPDLFAGAIVVSGQIPEAMRSIMARPERLKNFPLLVIHGLSDEIYPITQGRLINQLLSKYPVLMDYREYPFGHYLTQEAISDAGEWLTNRLDNLGVGGVPDLPDYQARLGHVQIKVRNLERSIRFYVRYLGLKLVERTGNAYAFLSANHSHHQLALQNIGPQGLVPHSESTGLYNIGFEVPDAAAFARAYKNLIHAGIPVSAIDHMVRRSLYFKDPDGNGVEIFLDTRALPGKSDLWEGRDLPLEPEHILSALAK